MQKYHQQLVFFALFITITYAVPVINVFQANELATGNNRSTVFDNRVQLWAVITNCSEPLCECHVTIDGSGDAQQPLEFRNDQTNISLIDISNLKSNTFYTFTLTCKQGEDYVSRKLNITTDYGRPEVPKNINASSASDHVEVTWSVPPLPPDPASYYKILVDNEIVAPNVPTSQTSYSITKEFKEGNHTLNIATCYTTKQNTPLCSDLSGGQATFVKETTTTTTTISAITITTTTPESTQSTQKSSGVYSYSFSIPTIIFSLLLLLSSKI